MVIKKGDRGSAVKEVQRALGISADGIFGSGTEAAVKRYQADHGLVADGIVGPNTMAKMSIESDTDQSNYNPANDKDGKLEMLGKYTSSCGLEIDRAYLDSNEYVRDYGKIEPRWFFLHHTAGGHNPYRTIRNWNNDDRGRVATQWCIGGQSKSGDTEFDGVVVECFPNNYLGWHLGKVGRFEMSKKSSAVEINNYGYLKKDGDKYYNAYKSQMPADQVCDLGYEFKGRRYWHNYTDAQMDATEKLLKHVKEIYPHIPISKGLPELLKKGIHPAVAFDFNEDAYNGKIEGVWTHTNVRKGKMDCYPHPRLVQMLIDLAE